MRHYRNRVQGNTTTTGTGALTISGTNTGYQAWSVLETGQYPYMVESADKATWEVGVGSFVNGTGVLTRTAIHESSAGLATAANFAAGTKTVSMLPIALAAFVSNFQAVSALKPIAAGLNAMAAGRSASAAGENALALGASWDRFGVTCQGSTASGEGALALQGGTASAFHSQAYGRYAVSTYEGKRAWSNMAAFTLSQTVANEMIANTSDATPTQMVAANGNTGFQVEASATLAFEILVVARRRGNNGAAAWKITGLADSGSGVDALIGAPTVTAIAASANMSGSAVAVTYDAATNTVRLQVTGIAATTIDWMAALHGAELA